MVEKIVLKGLLIYDSVSARIERNPFRVIYALVLAAFTAIYCELFRESKSYYLNGNYTGFLGQAPEQVSYGTIVLQGTFLFILYVFLFYCTEQFLKFVERHRYLVALLVLAICVSLKISGSSIGQWNKLFYTISTEDQLQQVGTLWGFPRAIRSDEWAVFTPFCLSQRYNDYGAISSIIRGTATDVTTVYGSAAWSLVTLFRPFFWGYLVLGTEYGLSFFWCARFLALVLSSYECAKIYTDNNCWLSASAAVMISLSPVILWWYNTNGLIEMFVFGQYAIVFLHHFMITKRRWMRFMCALGLVECAGGFAFTYYPAQEIPLAFTFLLIAVWLIVENFQLWHKQVKELLAFLGGAILLLLCLVIGILAFSSDTITAITSTVYPGNRVSLGGGGNVTALLSWLNNLLLPIDADRLLGGNPCEVATFFSLFPIGSMLALYMIKKRNDLLLKLIVSLQVFFVLFYLAEVPEWLAKATLMSNVTPNRLLVVIGFLEVCLLLRSLSHLLVVESNNKKRNVFFGVVLSILFVAMAANALASSSILLSDVPVYSIILILPAMLIFLLQINKDGQRGFVATLAVVLGTMGICVNPTQIGVPVFDMPIIKEIEAIAQEDSEGVWLADEYGFPFGNLPIMAGAPCINSTNVYPNLEDWYDLDETHEYEEVYNRYAHISVKLVDEINEIEKFSLISADVYQICLTPKDLDLLKIKYVLSPVDYRENLAWESKLKLICDSEPFYIYEVIQ